MLTTHLYAASNSAADSVTAPAPGRTLVQEAVVLTVLNRGSGNTPTQLVLFKRNSAADADGEQPVLAWKVVRCAPGQRVHVVVPFSQQVGVFDPCGPHAGMETASAGDLFAVAPSPGGAGPALRKVDGADGTVGANMVGVRSRALDRALDVVLYKDGRPLCRHSRLQAGALAMFEVLPYLHVADGTGLVEGELIDAEVVRAATRISLLGLKSADLMWTAAATAPVFQLANQRFS